MYTTHCVIWYLVEEVELIKTYPIEIPKWTIVNNRNGLLYGSNIWNYKSPMKLDH